MKSLITGASGFIGYTLTQHLIQQWGADSVQAMVGPSQHPTEDARLAELNRRNIPLIPMNLRRAEVFSKAPENFDVLFHLAAYVRTEVNSPEVHINDQGMERLLDQLGDQLKGTRVVFTSSIAAVDPFPHRRGRIEKDTPCFPRTDYGVTKLAAEEILKRKAKQWGFDYTVLRLCTVYGPGYRPGGMFDYLATAVPKEKFSARLAWPGRMSIVEVNDAVDILARVAMHPQAANRTLLVSSAEDPTMAEITACAAQWMKVSHRPISLPPWVVQMLMTLLGPWSQSRVLPHRLRTLAWRVSLLFNGLYCDGSELTSLFGISYKPWREMFGRMYGANEGKAL